MAPLDRNVTIDSAIAWMKAGRLAEAERVLRGILSTQPRHADALHLLGLVACRVGKHGMAIDLIHRAITLSPRFAAYHHNLGLAYKDRGELDAAEAAFRAALSLDARYVEALNNLGILLKDRGEVAAAVEVFERALSIAPTHPAALNSLGLARREQSRLDDAAAAYRAALQCSPDFFEAHANLANVLFEQGRPEAAIEEYQTALRLKPDAPDLRHDMGSAWMEAGDVAKAQSIYREILALYPHDARTHSSLIYSMHFPADADRDAIRAEQERWNREQVTLLLDQRAHHANSPDPVRRLKVGYVSPDFYDHAVAFFVVPLLEAHDAAQVEVWCYSTRRHSDAIAERLRKCAAVWRDVSRDSDAELAARIHADGIDILIDLAMHTAHNRLPALARRPAPVQASWLAYPGSTGVDGIDYHLTDAHLEADGGQAITLPDSWCCYEPIGEFPEVGELPARRAGYVTFASLNKFSRIHEGVLDGWAAVLRAVPRSRLILLCPEGRCRERPLALFERQGVAPERIHFTALRPWAEYVDLYRGIDIALDPFPCNGMTTTCHALWMGVPVVTLPGALPVARAGLSLLSTIGLAELAAESEAGYVRIAAALAADLPRLATWRATMRRRMRESPLMDAPRFARGMEAAYRRMWRRWCEKGGA